jgi:hypothetical protein
MHEIGVTDFGCEVRDTRPARPEDQVAASSWQRVAVTRPRYRRGMCGSLRCDGCREQHSHHSVSQGVSLVRMACTAFRVRPDICDDPDRWRGARQLVS